MLCMLLTEYMVHVLLVLDIQTWSRGDVLALELNDGDVDLLNR
jgi:hypothetical protein